MNRYHWLGLITIGIVCATALLGCQQRPAVPTLAPEPTEPVVVIVVTATSQPTLVPTKTSAATITPLPSLTAAGPITITATPGATSVARATTRPPATTGAPRPTIESQATTAPPEPTAPPATAVPSNFPAPQAIAPEGIRFSDGNTIKFEFTSVGALAADQCYRLDMTLGNPTGPGGVGDYWVGLCGNQSNAGDRLVFDVKPGRFRDEPNYGTLLVSADTIIPPTPEYTMQWMVSVVKVTDASDPIHPKVVGLSPGSAGLQNSFFR